MKIYTLAKLVVHFLLNPSTDFINYCFNCSLILWEHKCSNAIPIYFLFRYIQGRTKNEKWRLLISDEHVTLRIDLIWFRTPCVLIRWQSRMFTNTQLLPHFFLNIFFLFVTISEFWEKLQYFIFTVDEPGINILNDNSTSTISVKKFHENGHCIDEFRYHTSTDELKH